MASLVRSQRLRYAISRDDTESQLQGKSIQPPGKFWICTKTPIDRRFPGNNRTLHNHKPQEISNEPKDSFNQNHNYNHNRNHNSVWRTPTVQFSIPGSSQFTSDSQNRSDRKFSRDSTQLPFSH